MSIAESIVTFLLEEESDPEDIIRRSGITAQPDDFAVEIRQIGAPGMWTGNYYYHISYKPILYRGKPLYLGTVIGSHDYNRTGSPHVVNYHVSSVPSWQQAHTGLKRGVDKPSPFKGGPKYRKYHGHRGYVSMKAPEYQNFNNLFDAEKYLLSLLKHNANLRYAS